MTFIHYKSFLFLMINQLLNPFKCFTTFTVQIVRQRLSDVLKHVPCCLFQMFSHSRFYRKRSRNRSQKHFSSSCVSSVVSGCSSSIDSVCKTNCTASTFAFLSETTDCGSKSE